MNISSTFLLKNILRLAFVFLFLVAIVHLSDVRFIDVEGIWDSETMGYAKLISRLFGSFSLILAIISLVASFDLKRNKNIIAAAGLGSLFHTFMLILNTYSSNYDGLFFAHPSLKVYLPFYNLHLVGEALLAGSYGFVALWWYSKNRHEKNT